MLSRSAPPHRVRHAARMQKLRKAGACDDAVGLVLPTGYSFNLDGASLYLSIGTLFIAQAVGVDLSLGQTDHRDPWCSCSPARAWPSIPGSASLALSATASSLGAIPAGAVALLLGVDRIMDSMRVVTNLLGNCVAVFAVSRWEGALDIERAKKVLDGEITVVEVEDDGVENGVEADAEIPAQLVKESASEAG
ncbi:cation:dicarboxylate symporter family transporter [Streptomyces sp. L7]